MGGLGNSASRINVLRYSSGFQTFSLLLLQLLERISVFCKISLVVQVLMLFYFSADWENIPLNNLAYPYYHVILFDSLYNSGY